MNSIEYMNRAIDADTPRIVRSQLTKMSEQVATLRALESQLRERDLEEAAEGLCDVAIHLGRARSALELVTPLLASATAPPPMGAGATTEETRDRADRSKVGQPKLLVSVLADCGLTSSSGKAKRAIRSGAVYVDDQLITNPAAMLEPGAYQIRCGEQAADVRV